MSIKYTTVVLYCCSSVIGKIINFAYFLLIKCRNFTT